MSSSIELAIKGKGNKRIPVSECKLQPLNLFIPGGVPIMVPKFKTRPGMMEKKKATSSKAPTLPEDSSDTEEENTSCEAPAATLPQSRTSKAISTATTNASIKPDNIKNLKVPCKRMAKLNKLVTEARQHKEQEQQATCSTEHERYIAKLRAKYAPNKQAHAKETFSDDEEPEFHLETGISSESTVNVSNQASSATSTNGALTGTSEKVRHMIKSLKIKAAGTEEAEFNPSEDSQIMARWENGEGYSMIASCMNRSRKQITKRHQELLELGKTAETAGTDFAATEGDTGGDNGNGGDKMLPDAFGGLFDLAGLQSRSESSAAEPRPAQARADTRPRELEKRHPRTKQQGHGDNRGDTASSHPKFTPVGILKAPGGEKKNKKNMNKNAKLASPAAEEAAVGTESGCESGLELEDTSTKVFISYYARQMLSNDAAVPEADDKFDKYDCILLALANARQKGDRWKQIQADFANLTGRMVPIELLRYKIGDGQEP